MGVVALEGMQFYAYHGFYEEEQLIGNDYVVDVYLDVNFSGAAQTDELEGTINYETIYRIAKIEMSKKTKLLETIAKRIIDRIRKIFSSVRGVKVRITKQNPPLGARIAKAFVELEESYIVACNKCGKKFLSHEEEDCWTKYGHIYEETKATLKRNYGPNMCKKCLTPYFVKPRE